MFRFGNHPAALAAWKLLLALLHEARIVPDDARSLMDDRDVICQKNGIRGRELVWFRELHGDFCVVALSYRDQEANTCRSICYMENGDAWSMDGQAASSEVAAQCIRAILAEMTQP
ncbi:hypothetical protein FJZ48_01430 [Candidatus Uhrbacteria bacterium]|nr:hypothetical protein [Candidatus Uhrbacteria bacterium]